MPRPAAPERTDRRERSVAGDEGMTTPVRGTSSRALARVAWRGEAGAGWRAGGGGGGHTPPPGWWGGAPEAGGGRRATPAATGLIGDLAGGSVLEADHGLDGATVVHVLRGLVEV